MVKIGDEIELEDGERVRVMNIQETFCNRYLITYEKREIKQFLEGDVDFKVVG